MAYSVLSSNSQRAGRVNVLRDAMAVDTLDACGVYLGTTGGQVYGSADAASTRRQSAGGGMRVLDASAAQHVHDRVVPWQANSKGGPLATPRPDWSVDSGKRTVHGWVKRIGSVIVAS